METEKVLIKDVEPGKHIRFNKSHFKVEGSQENGKIKAICTGDSARGKYDLGNVIELDPDTEVRLIFEQVGHLGENIVCIGDLLRRSSKHRNTGGGDINKLFGHIVKVVGETKIMIKAIVVDGDKLAPESRVFFYKVDLLPKFFNLIDD